MITILGVVLRLYPALIPARGKHCYSSKIVWIGFGAHSYPLLCGFTGPFPGVKQASFEVYRLLPSSAEDKNVCGTSLPLSTCALKVCTRTALCSLSLRTGDRDSFVGRDSHFGLNDPAGKEIFSSRHAFTPAVGFTQPPVRWGTWPFSWLGVDHSPPSSAAAKNEQKYTSIPPLYLCGNLRGHLYHLLRGFNV